MIHHHHCNSSMLHWSCQKLLDFTVYAWILCWPPRTWNDWLIDIAQTRYNWFAYWADRDVHRWLCQICIVLLHRCIGKSTSEQATWHHLSASRMADEKRWNTQLETWSHYVVVKNKYDVLLLCSMQAFQSLRRFDQAYLSCSCRSAGAQKALRHGLRCSFNMHQASDPGSNLCCTAVVFKTRPWSSNLRLTTCTGAHGRAAW